jgi:predicted lipoprotein with Yx(FWY)xxD motif
MKRLIVPGMAVAAALTISACGGGGGGGSASSGSPASSSDTVSVQQVSDVGRVLVDQSGNPIYTSDQEASGKIVCDSACTSFWKPVTAAGGTPTASAGAGKLGVIKRPDGTKQVTANGRPLYTFSEDSPGKSTGDGFTDDFSGHHFTWHVVRAGGKTAAGSKTGGGGKTGKGDGSTSPYDSSGGGFGY